MEFRDSKIFDPMGNVLGFLKETRNGRIDAFYKNGGYCGFYRKYGNCTYSRDGKVIGSGNLLLKNFFPTAELEKFYNFNGFEVPKFEFV